MLPVISAALVYPAGGRRRGEYTFTPGLHSSDCIIKGMGVVSPREGNLLPGRRFLEPERGSLVLEQGFLELM
jgi:hypothetical protein